MIDLNLFGKADDESTDGISVSSRQAVLNERTRVEEELEGVSTTSPSSRLKDFFNRIRGVDHASNSAKQFLERNASERRLVGGQHRGAVMDLGPPQKRNEVESRQAESSESTEVPERDRYTPDNLTPMQRMRGGNAKNQEDRAALDIIEEEEDDDDDDAETVDTHWTSDSSLFSFHSLSSASTVWAGNGFQRVRSDVESVTSAWSGSNRIVALFDKIPEESEIEALYVSGDDPWSAARRGDLKALKILAKLPSTDWSQVDEHKFTPLYYACQSGAEASEDGLQAVLLLLESWPDEKIPDEVLSQCRRNAINTDVGRLLNGDPTVLGRVIRQRKFSEEKSNEYDGDEGGSDRYATLSIG